MKEYKVNVDGKEIVYGALVERSNFTEKEWLSIYREATKQNMPSFYERYKNNGEVISITGYLIDLEERYEALLELLPQSTFSEAGTHPKWVADAVTINTIDKGITQDDVKMFIEESHALEGLKEELVYYFELEGTE